MSEKHAGCTAALFSFWYQSIYFHKVVTSEQQIRWFIGAFGNNPYCMPTYYLRMALVRVF